MCCCIYWQFHHRPNVITRSLHFVYNAHFPMEHVGANGPLNTKGNAYISTRWDVIIADVHWDGLGSMFNIAFGFGRHFTDGIQKHSVLVCDIVTCLPTEGTTEYRRKARSRLFRSADQHLQRRIYIWLPQDEEHKFHVQGEVNTCIMLCTSKCSA